MNKHFEKIYLSEVLGEITWCQDRQSEKDVVYVPEAQLTASKKECADYKRILTFCQEWFKEGGYVRAWLKGREGYNFLATIDKLLTPPQPKETE